MISLHHLSYHDSWHLYCLIPIWFVNYNHHTHFWAMLLSTYVHHFVTISIVLSFSLFASRCHYLIIHVTRCRKTYRHILLLYIVLMRFIAHSSFCLSIYLHVSLDWHYNYQLSSRCVYRHCQLLRSNTFIVL